MRARNSLAAATAALLAFLMPGPASPQAPSSPQAPTQAIAATFDLGLSAGLPDGLSLLQRLIFQWESGPFLGLEARVPSSSYMLLFPIDGEADGFKTDSLRMLDVDWGLACGWRFTAGKAWETSLALSLGGLVSYRSCAYEDELYGYGGEYSRWTWLKEARVSASASASIGSLTRLRGLEPLRLGIEASLPLRDILYMAERYSVGLSLSWRFGEARQG